MAIALLGFVLVVFVATFALVWKSSVREIPDNQRAAIFRAGSFVKLGGPGRTMVVPLLDRAIPLALDDVGVALVEGSAQFGGANIPIRSAAHLDTGESVRIIGFDREAAAVVEKA